MTKENPRKISKEELIQKYISLHKKYKNVTRKIYAQEAAGKDAVCNTFGSFKGLENEVRRLHPELFKDVKIQDIYSKNLLENIDNAIKKHKKFIITTAVVGCPVDEGFYKSIKNYCHKNKAELLILLSADPASIADNTIDKKIANEIILLKDAHLNRKVFISTIKLSAKHIDPITNLLRIGQRHGSFIYASPKQRLRVVPVANMKYPHAIMTTGAITKPNYKTEKYMSERTAYIAENDHVMGAVVVEIENDKLFHYRQVQADKSGAFIDLGKKYNADGTVEDVRPEAFVLGDWHSGETDKLASKAWCEISTQLKPKQIVLHDAFNGMSINHHEEKNNILRAKRAENQTLNLLTEIKFLASDLDFLSKFCDSLVLVKSNHDEFLERYLQDGKYVTDPQNHRISLELSLAMLDGKDPLKYGTEKFLQNPSKIKWLKRDEDLIITPLKIQIGSHGDKGANGARGSINSMENSFGNSVTGHSHSPQILRGAWIVGTSSLLKLNYNHGPSSWMHCSCLVYPNGSRQLINVIEGRWRLK